MVSKTKTETVKHSAEHWLTLNTGPFQGATQANSSWSKTDGPAKAHHKHINGHINQKAEELISSDDLLYEKPMCNCLFSLAVCVLSTELPL